MSDLSQKLINGDALDSFAKKLNDKIQDDIKEVDTKVSTHNHDDKYYTESEIDTKLANKADKEHGTHLTLGTGSGNAFRGDYGNTAYNHSQAAHAPSNAQKNSDITKAEIEAKLTGAITSHTHNYAGSSSAGGAATSANKVNTDLTIKLNSGTTEGTNLFTFNGSAAKTINITPSSIGAAASSHGTHLTLGTGSSNAYYGDKGKIAYDHSQAAHAPSDAQKNSDITKAEIEAKLTGTISSHTHAAATTSANGLMSSTDKSKLDGIAENANNYTHPSTHAATMITEDATHRFVTDTEKSTWNAKSNLTLGTTSTTAAAGNHTHNYAGSSSAGGAATSANKVNTNLIIKLNGGATEGTDLFTFNGSTAKTINITPSAIGAASISDIPDPTETITNEIIDSAFSSVGL